MDRISTNLPNDNMQFYLRERQKLMEEAQNAIASQSRVEELRHDPIAAAHSTRYRSYVTRLARFSDNAQTVIERNHIAEVHMQRATDILQRARELAIQAANGIYTPEDLDVMAGEVDQILQEMVEIANARGADGTTIFGGDRTTQIPFREINAIRAGDSAPRITGVEYTGTINPQSSEISENSFIQTNFPGNQVFWAENQQIASRVDAAAYQVDQDAVFAINGIEIRAVEGDTLYSLVQKINESGAAVQASIDPVFSSIVVETTSPHQIWLQESPDSTVLQDLGLTVDSVAPPPQNVAPSAIRSGGSVFDALIRLRDQMAGGDQQAIGGRGILGIDLSLDNVVTNMGRLGAINSRLEGTFRRHETEMLDVENRNSRLTDIDLAQAITELRELEATHRAALGVSARIIQPTLLDFLR